eukprot:3825480-Pleurochrysis_carterae.AAC.1
MRCCTIEQQSQGTQVAVSAASVDTATAVCTACIRRGATANRVHLGTYSGKVAGEEKLEVDFGSRQTIAPPQTDRLSCKCQAQAGATQSMTENQAAGYSLLLQQTYACGGVPHRAEC